MAHVVTVEAPGGHASSGYANATKLVETTTAQRTSRRRTGWRTALLATTALIAAGLALPERGAADQTLAGNHNVPPNISEPGVLTVTGKLDIRFNGTVQTQHHVTDGGEVTVYTGGILTVTGIKTMLDGEFSLIGGTVDVGALSVQGGDITLNNGEFTVQTTTTISAGSLTKNGASEFLATGALLVEGTGELKTNTDFTALDAVTITGGNILANQSFGVNAALLVSGGTLRHNNTMIVQGTTTVTGGELQSYNTFTATGAVTVDGGLLTSFGALTADSTTTVTSGELVNYASYLATEAVLVEGTGKLTHKGGFFEAISTTTVTGGSLVVEGGTYAATGAVAVTGTGVLALSGGTLNAMSTTTVSAGTLIVGIGAYSAVGAVLVEGTGALTNSGVFNAESTTTVTGGTLSAGIYNAGGAVLVSGGALMSADFFTASGTTTVTGGEIRVLAGNYQALGQTTIAGGTLTIAAVAVFEAFGGFGGSDGTNDTLTVLGTLNVPGAIALGTGDDILTIGTDAKILDTSTPDDAGTDGGEDTPDKAVVDGGEGTDTLRLTGEGSKAANMSRFSNFEIIEKQDAGNWTLTGGTAGAPTTVQSITVDTGELVLLGIWKVTGNTTTVAAGTTLTVGDGGTQTLLEEAQGLSVSGMLNINANGTVQAQDHVIGGGTVAVNDGGVLTVTGTTTIQAGTLTVNDGGTFNAGPIVIEGGEVRLVGSTSTSGDISSNTSSAGAFFVLADGASHTVFGSATFTDMTVNLVTTSDAAPKPTLRITGNLTVFGIDRFTDFRVFRSGPVTVEGDLLVSGDARVLVQVEGSMTVMGAATVAGANGETASLRVEQKDAVITVHGPIVIQDDGELNVSRSGNDRATFNALSTTTLNGTAKLVLVGTYNAGAPITVNGGRVIGFEGILNGEFHNLGGTLEPHFFAGSTSALSVFGAYRQGSAATFSVNLKANGDADLLAVTGTTQLAGLVAVNIVDTGIVAGQQFRIVATDNPITGMFETANLTGEPIGELTAVVLKANDGGAYATDGNNIDVLFVAPVVSTKGLSGNRAAIAAVLGGTLPAGGIVIYDETVGAALAASVSPQTLDQFSPEPYDSFTAFSFEVARIFGGLIDSRVRGLRDGGSGIGTPGLFASDRRDPVLIADTSGTPGGVARPKAPGDYSNGIGPRPSGWSVWASGIGSGLWLDQSAGNLGYSGWTAGGAAGVDLRLAKGFVVGVLAGGSRSTIDFDGVSGDGDMDSVTTGVYAAWVGKRLFANTAFTYTKNWVEADRDITAMGATANGKTEGDQYAVHATVGVGFRLKRLSIEASGGVDWVTLNQKGFTETGAGALNLTVDSRSDDSLRLRAGIRLATAVRVRPGFVLVPSARVGYARELMDTTRPITASLAGVGGAFTVTGDEGGRDFVTYGGGIQAKWSQGLTLYFDYAGEWATDRTASTFSGGVKVSW